MIRYVDAATPWIRRRANAACGTVLVRASPSRTTPASSGPPAPTTAATMNAHAATHPDGGRRLRAPTIIAMIPHSTAPTPEEPAAIGIPDDPA